MARHSDSDNPRVDPLREDFRNFVYVLWKHLRLPDPTPVQYDISQHLQAGDRREIIEAFRGVGKSYLTVAFCLWCWYRDPELKILVVSASKDRAIEFTTFAKRMISEVPILRHLAPQKGQRDSVMAFDVGPAGASGSPSCKSVGITGQLTGTRADIIIADDVEVPKNSYTAGMRARLAELVKEFDAVLKPSGRIVYLGTPQTQMSLYNQLLERGYKMRIWPAQYPSPEKIDEYRGNLAPWIYERIVNGQAASGDPVDPDRFDTLDLLERRASYGALGYAMQFMLDTSLSDADRYPLKLRDLIVTSLDSQMGPTAIAWGAGKDNLDTELDNVGLTGDGIYNPMYVSPDWAPYTGSVLAVDPSGRGKDRTTYAVVKILHGRLFLTECGSLEGGYDDDTLEAIALAAKRQKVNMVLVESNFGDGMFASLLSPWLRRHHPATLEEVRATQQKELRIIDTLEPVLMQHRLVVDRQIFEQDINREPEHQLFYQLTRITRERGALAHDDLLDVLAMAVGYWQEEMKADEREAEDEWRREELDRMLEDFVESVGLSKGSGNTNYTEEF